MEIDAMSHKRNFHMGTKQSETKSLATKEIRI